MPGATKAEIARHLVQHVLEGLHTPSEAWQRAQALEVTKAHLVAAVAFHRERAAEIVTRLDALTARLDQVGG